MISNTKWPRPLREKCRKCGMTIPIPFQISTIMNTNRMNIPKHFQASLAIQRFSGDVASEADETLAGSPAAIVTDAGVNREPHSEQYSVCAAFSSPQYVHSPSFTRFEIRADLSGLTVGAAGNG